MVDRPGTYTVQLIVNDGTVGSPPATVTITTQNAPPVAQAGAAQTVAVGSTVRLDGSQSSDVNGNPLTFRWVLLTLPPGSSATLSTATGVQSTFVVDRPGTYTVRLIVNDGTLDSAPVTITISTSNSPPIAQAGPAQTVTVGATVQLDGSRSSDVDGNPLTFRWALTVVPTGSAARLSNATSVQSTFVVDRPGTYTAQLIVNDGTLDSPPATVPITTNNSLPVAQAGPAQTVTVGATVQLDGSRSSDVDGNPLTFRWALTVVPAGSGATLSTPTEAQSTFVVDRPGTYTAQLIVNDGTVDSLPATVTMTTVNSPPIAQAGPAQTVALGATVQLDGNRSSDVDGNPLTFRWALTVVPAGSGATLSTPTEVQSTFVVDRPGTYTAQLIVNDGTVDSLPATVTMTTGNSPPIAQAGSAQTVALGATVQLDGSRSSDVDGNPLTFRWTLTTLPSGSTATLTNPSSVQPTFVVDRPGIYIAQLIVNDGTLDSPPATVTITTTNSPPIAQAGPAQTVTVGATVQLDGSQSRDADGDPLTFRWALTVVPSGSTATLSNPTSVHPTFRVDRPGIYTAQLIVHDGTVDSTPATVTITTGNSAPVAEAGPEQTVAIGATVQLDGSQSRDADGNPLTFRWALTVVPTDSTTTLANPSTARPSFVAAKAGTYVAQLIVNDGTVDSAPDTVTIKTTDTTPPTLQFVTPVDGGTVNTTTPTFTVTFSDDGSGLRLASYKTTVNGVDVTAGTVVTPTGATYTPAAPLPAGDNTATAQIADNAGNLRSVSIRFTIAVFRAIANCAPTSGMVPLQVTFRSRGEFTGGTIVQYRWDYQGDEVFDTSDPVAADRTFTFTTAGTFRSVLQVTNNLGNTATDTCTIQAANAPPTVTANVTPSNGAVPLSVALTCSGTASSGSIVLYEWDFEGDAIFDYSSPTSGNTNHTYATAGTFVAICRVTDSGGLTGLARTTTTVIRPGPPGSPSVTATATPGSGNAPMTVTFNGSVSSGGPIVKWEWDFDGDGVFDFSSTTSTATTLQYTSGGIFAAALRATNDQGLSSIDTAEVIVNLTATLAIPTDTFDPTAGQTAAINMSISTLVPVRVLVKDRNGAAVRTLVNTFRPAGSYADVWNGKDNNGRLLPQGPYFAILEYDFAGTVRRVDLTNSTGGARYNPTRNSLPSTFRPFNNELLTINLTIPASQGASEIQAFIGLFNTDTRFVTLLDRVPLGVGAHTIYWDDLNTAGQFAVPPPGDAFLFGMFGFTLPANALFVQATPVLSAVTVTPNYFDPSTPDFLTAAQPTATVTYTLDKRADLELTVTNLTTGRVLRRILVPNVAGGTGRTILWDGHADDGRFVDQGDYRLALQAIDSTGSPSLTRFALVRVFY